MPRLEKNILLVVHEFSPYIGSECEQGWNLGRAISEYSNHNIYICYASGNQFHPKLYSENLNKYGYKFNNRHICVEYTIKLRILGSLNRLFVGRFGPIGFPPLFFYIYSLWQKAALRKVKSLSIDFDTVHVLNLINGTSPGPWWKLKAKSIIWGPTGGLEYAKLTSIRELLRNIFVFLSKKSLNYRMFVKYCSTIFVFDKSVIAREKQFKLPESGISSINPILKIKNKTTLNCYFAGHFNHRKGFDVYNKLACSYRKDEGFRFYCFGKGYIAPSPYIVNYGFLKRDVFIEHLKNMDILILPSYREGTPQVIMEAISKNILVISTDVGGIPFFISEKCCLPVDSFYKNAQSLLRDLKNHDFFNECLMNQHLKSKSLSWDDIAKKISSHYD